MKYITTRNLTNPIEIWYTIMPLNVPAAATHALMLYYSLEIFTNIQPTVGIILRSPHVTSRI